MAQNTAPVTMFDPMAEDPPTLLRAFQVMRDDRRVYRILCAAIAIAAFAGCAADAHAPTQDTVNGLPSAPGAIGASSPGVNGAANGGGAGTSRIGVAGNGQGGGGGTAGAALTNRDAGAKDAGVSMSMRDARVSMAGGNGGSAGGAGAAGMQANDAGMVVPSSPGYLHTQGGGIVDAMGHEVRLTGLSWFGMETSNYAPHGLWSRSLDSMLDQITSLGYNMIRLPFCSQLFDAGSTPNGTSASPDLNGLNGLAIMDKVVAGAGKRGLKIVLDRHRPDSGGQSPLWYTSQYSEQRWIDDWKMLATHYMGNTTVIGFDLHNEPHDPATWGDGSMTTDWRAAAERAGNAVLSVNPNLLIIVEGIQTYNKTSYWWGGNLRGAATQPVRLNVRDRLVYSAHDYPASVNAQAWFSDPTYPSNLVMVWHDAWGYVAEQGLAPIWIGEFGTKNQTSSDQQWLQALTGYIQQHKLSFAYWCWNPNSGDTGGILQDDWKTVNQDKQNALQPLLSPLIP